MKKGKCKLCLEVKELCKSHILPEFVYDDIYDDTNKYYEFTGTQKIRNRKRRKGAWEYLLCRGCEDRIEVYEDYSAKILFKNLNITFPNTNETQKTIISDINYKKFKLFILSVLWRSSISQHSNFRDVCLGSYEDKIRLIIYNEKLIPPNHYNCLIAAAVDRGTHVKGLIIEPIRKKMDYSTVYQFVFGGFIWLIPVGTKQIKLLPTGISLTENKLTIF